MSDLNRIKWMADDESPNCSICKSEWGIINRRHHCRHCGRLVCSSCSPHKVALDSASEGEVSCPVQQRCCSQCFEGLMKNRSALAVDSFLGSGQIGENVEWMSNSSSKICTLCKTAWSVNNWRHHCRHCGRLVCKTCSSRKINTDSLGISVIHGNGNSGPTSERETVVQGQGLGQVAGEGGSDVRCCDECYEVLNKRRY